MWVKVNDKSLEAGVKDLVKKVLKDNLTYRWIKDVVEDEIRKIVKVNIQKP